MLESFEKIQQSVSYEHEWFVTQDLKYKNEFKAIAL